MQRERFEARKSALAIGWGLAPHQDPKKKMDLVELAGGMVGRELPRYGAMLYPFERHYDDGERVFSPPNEDE